MHSVIIVCEVLNVHSLLTCVDLFFFFELIPIYDKQEFQHFLALCVPQLFILTRYLVPQNKINVKDN